MNPGVGRQRSPEDALLAAATRRLAAAGCVAAGDEAAELVGAAPSPPTVEAWLRRREQGEPLAWITGRTRFCDLVLHVSPGVYVPRPQSEELARRAVRLLPSGGRAVDLCTGIGAVAAHLGRSVPTARVVGTDIDPRAAACARRNGVPAMVADLADALAGGYVDLVTAVAPYVPTAGLDLLPSDVRAHEPLLALDGGDDGLDVVRRVLSAAGRLLRPGGWLLVEVGGTQDDDLAPALERAGFSRWESWRDDDGDLRGLAARRR